MRKFSQTWQTNWNKKVSRYVSVVAVLAIGGLGTMLLFTSHAATPTSSLEVESGTVSSKACTGSDSSSSGGGYVKFGGCVAGTNDEIHYTITGPTSVSFDWRGNATDIRYGLTTSYGSTG